MFKLMRVACLVLSFILPFVVLPAGVAASGMVSSKGSEMQKIIPSSSSTSENSDSTNSAKKTKKEETVEDKKSRIMSDVVLSTETNNACLILSPAPSPVSLVASVSETSTTAKKKERKTFEVEQPHTITTSGVDTNTITISNIESQAGGISINNIGSGPSMAISNAPIAISMIDPSRKPHKYPSDEVKSVIEALVHGDKFALFRALNTHPVPDLSLEDATGRTPLDYALAESPSDFAPQAIRILMAYKAVPGTSKESQALQLARLVASDAPVNPEGLSVDTRLPNGFTPFLWAAVLASRADTLEHLLNAGADLHQCLPVHEGVNESLCRNDALFLAVRWNLHSATTHFLVRKGLDPNQTSPDGQTLLMVACHAGNFDAVEALLHAGVDLESADTNGMTAFLIAASKSNMPMMQRLVIAGANPSAASREGMTALHFLLKKGVSNDSVSWLLSLGVPINAKLCRAQGELTPLMLAVRHLRPQASVIRSLLDNGADPKLRDGEGRRAVDGLSTEQIRWLKQNDLYGLLNQ